MQTLKQRSTADSGVHVLQIADFLVQSKDLKGRPNGIAAVYGFERDTSRSRQAILATLVIDAYPRLEPASIWLVSVHLELDPHAVEAPSTDLVPCPLGEFTPIRCDRPTLPTKNGMHTHTTSWSVDDHAAALFTLGINRCVPCEVGFFDPSHLKSHKKKIHADELVPLLECDAGQVIPGGCDTQLPKDAMVQHIRHEHKQDLFELTEWQCPPCESGWLYQADLNRHLKHCTKSKALQLMPRLDRATLMAELLPQVGGVVVTA